MRTIVAIVRLSRRLFEVPRDDIGRHAVQDRAVEEERASLPSLRVSRDLHVADHQIADASEGGGRLPSAECAGDPFKDELIGTADIREVVVQLKRKHEGVRETSRSLEDGASAAHPPKDGDSVLFAGGQVDVVADAAGTTQHDEVTVTLPKAKHRIAAMLLQLFQQRFVEGQILSRRGESQIEQTKCAHVVIAWR